MTRTWGGSAIGGDIVLVELTPLLFSKTRKLAVI
jgi:hypothetical protein